MFTEEELLAVAQRNGIGTLTDPETRAWVTMLAWVERGTHTSFAGQAFFDGQVDLPDSEVPGENYKLPVKTILTEMIQSNLWDRQSQRDYVDTAFDGSDEV